MFDIWYWHITAKLYLAMDNNTTATQGRRHGFESGGGQFCERSEPKKFFWPPPHFLASGGGQNIA